MNRRTMAAGLVLGAALAMVPAPANGGAGWPGNFEPAAGLDTSQVLDAESAELGGLLAADGSQLWRAVSMRFPETPAGDMEPITDVLIGRSGERVS